MHDSYLMGYTPYVDKALGKVATYIPFERLAAGGSLVVAVAIGGGFFYQYTQIASLSSHVAVLDMQIASTTALLESALATTTSALLQQQQSVSAVQAQLGDFKDEVGDISGTVNTLEKLAKIDPELLAKYSKVFFLSENYAPTRLAQIPEEYKYTPNKDLQLIPQVVNHLEDMLEDAIDHGIKIYVQSAYRSFDTQEALKGQYSVTYGPGSANQFSADQGYSEHQLGTTVDFITTGTGGSLAGFDNTQAYAWLRENAYKYGFVLSYPKGNTYYVYEPWHWRFVGEKLATYLNRQKKNFYDLDQRTIDKYLVSIFD